MKSNINTDVQVQIDLGIEANADWSDILTNLISLYADPWFVMSIAMTFGVGMLAYLCMKAYKPKTFWVTTLLIILGIELVSGYFISQLLVESDDYRYSMITGFNAAVAYWVADYLAGKFGLVKVQAFLRLKALRKDKAGDLELGDTIQFDSKDK